MVFEPVVSTTDSCVMSGINDIGDSKWTCL